MKKELPTTMFPASMFRLPFTLALPVTVAVPESLLMVRF
jgi:hypothetical protein